MLNLSDNKIDQSQYEGDYLSLAQVEDRRKPLKVLRIFLIILSVLLGALFLPWTQNMRVPGNLTTLYPEQRPQTVQNVIPGRIEQWYVKEGDLVDVGDTIVRITEVKDEYFDPALLERTAEQIEAKRQAAENYDQKAAALVLQIAALNANRANKLEQAVNKLEQTRLMVVSDSMSVEAAALDYQIATQRLERMEELYDQGLKSLTDLEGRRLLLQENQASLISAQNKLLSTRNELINARIELRAIENDYREKLAKAQSDRNTALSTFFDTQAEISKMENQLSNYRVRQDNYYIKAPVRGYVTKAISVGIGENIKEGSKIVSIMPATYDLAVEMYVEPINFPLLEKEGTVRLVFDGWPAIVFSGWPQLSNGTFGGRIFAIDNFISNNGKYRIIVVPDESDIPWPEELRVGTGSDGILLLKDVPLWYELWRQLNGFPPDFYKSDPRMNTAEGEFLKNLEVK
jgi:multidrug resistance efflux pump